MCAEAGNLLPPLATESDSAPEASSAAAALKPGRFLRSSGGGGGEATGAPEPGAAARLQHASPSGGGAAAAASSCSSQDGDAGARMLAATGMSDGPAPSSSSSVSDSVASQQRERRASPRGSPKAPAVRVQRLSGGAAPQQQLDHHGVGVSSADCEWTSIEGDFISVMSVVTPCRSDKSKAGIVPCAHLADGRMYLVLVSSDCNHLQYIRFLLTLSGSGLRDLCLPYVRVLPVSAVRVRPIGEESSWNVDGELLTHNSVSIRVHRGLVDVFARGVELPR